MVDAEYEVLRHHDDEPIDDLVSGSMTMGVNPQKAQKTSTDTKAISVVVEPHQVFRAPVNEYVMEEDAIDLQA